MEERREEQTGFSVRVFTLQEEARGEEEHMEEHGEEVSEEQQVRVCRQRGEEELTVLLRSGPEGQQVTVQDAGRASVYQFSVSSESELCQVGGQSLVVTVDELSLLLRFEAPSDLKNFQKLLRRETGEEMRRGGEDGGHEDARRMHDAPAQNYQFHSCLSQQQSLLREYPRIATYHRAILDNEADFKDKVVLDLRCGSAILSFFAVQAGASRVYAVESRPMSRFSQILVQSNSLSERIRVLDRALEEFICPEMVDVIMSEPMGYMLLGDRFLQSFLRARKYLKSNGLMFPSCADIHLAPFTDEQLYFEHHARATFWQQTNFFGVNLSGLHGAAVDEFFRQPIVDSFDVQILMARSIKHRINFKEATEEELLRVEIPFVFSLLQPGLIHGLAFWFDVAYQGSRSTLWLSTSPSEPPTCWSQVRCLLQTPLFAKLGQTLSGTVLMVANSRQSYDIHITATVDQSGFRSGNILDLKNPFLRVPTWFHC
ncbi:histone-arginine methyltransferase CARM1-like [Notolabrus celidotus]|uniref:histone-arginine methyltransferase CARM1-like n=1 Tax=Notolabrus celidotus TaxID=1203425 RepID=UPI00148FC21F|nr:histone-arginine methyltransferase CARM1-like [Notolabrus celidotus]